MTKENLEEFLGKERYEFQPANEKPEIGIVRGLAWTAVGGDTLQIEVNVMPGKGEFLLTGQLGDVMKESAQAGISFIRSVAEQYEIPKEFFEKHDIHIHIPEGAVQKMARLPVLRCDGDGFRDHKGSGKSRRCDDRRDYAPRPCASDRRLKREAAGGKESRYPYGSRSGEK